MGPVELLKMEIEREERGWIMMEFQRVSESAGEIPRCLYPLDRLKAHLVLIGSFLTGLFVGAFSMFFLYGIIEIMKL